MQDFPQGIVPDGEGLAFQDAFGLEDSGQAAEGSGQGDEDSLEGSGQGGLDGLDTSGYFYNA